MLEEDPSCGLKYIMPEHVIASLEKMIPLEDGSDFYFNIPGYSYYIDKKIDHIQKGDVNTIYLRSDRYDPTALSDYLLNVPANTKLEEADEETFKKISNVGA